jgi:osmotically-inducible protein OsmY
MNAFSRLVTAFAAGAATMYFLDPAAGRGRRARVRDRGIAAGHDIEDYARTSGRRAVDKLHGAAAEARAHLANPPVGDQQLHDRIRAKLGRIVEEPATVSVHVDHGRVILNGSASAEEIESLARTVAAMRGVTDVDVRVRAPSMPAH